jgi:enoyl-[acyl-carrier protein] reductase I
MMGLMKDKKGLIFGVANRRSIAWGIAESLASQGAILGFSVQNEHFRENVLELAAEIKQDKHIVITDVLDEISVHECFHQAQEWWGGLDFVVHSIAYAKKEDLANEFLETRGDGWNTALGVSAYSLVAVARHAKPLLAINGGGSIIAMTYFGSEKVFPGYNVMGVAKAALESSIRYLAYDLGSSNIRINGISAGPVKTLAASGIKSFSQLHHSAGRKSPLQRNVEVEDIAKTAVFLCSDMASGITGDVIFVDCGYHIMGA